LTSGPVHTPERRLRLCRWDNRSPGEEGTPRPFADAVPLSVAPPDRPLFLGRGHRDWKTKCSTGRATRVRHGSAPCERWQLSNHFSCLVLRQDGYAPEICQASDVGRLDTCRAKSVSIKRDRRRAPHGCYESPVTEGLHVASRPVGPTDNFLEDGVERVGVAGSFRSPSHQRAGG